jgi:hypothetical protein
MNKNDKNQRIIISNVCKMFLVNVSQTLSRPVVNNTNRHYDYDIFNRQINIPFNRS